MVIYTARSRYWARVFEAALRLEGIDVELVDAAASARSDHPVDLVVDADDADRARALAEDFERYQVSVAGDGPSERELRDSGRGTDDGDVEIDQAALVDMLESVRIEGGDCPTCPKCERPRLAVCPYCETSSSEMPQGDPRYGGQSFTELLATENDEQTGATSKCCGKGNCCAEDEPGDTGLQPTALLICPTCDEPFEARYLRRCEWCGHDFGEGLEVPPQSPVTPIDINTRAVALTVAMVVGMSLLVLYFSYL